MEHLVNEIAESIAKLPNHQIIKLKNINVC